MNLKTSGDLADRICPMHSSVTPMGPSVYTSTSNKSSNHHDSEEAMKINVGPYVFQKAPSPAPQQVGTSTALKLSDGASILISKDDRKGNARVKKVFSN